MKLQFSLSTRTTLSLLTGMVGMIWQGTIATLGGTTSRDLIAASVTLILASLGLGIHRDNKDNGDTSGKQ